MPPDHDWRSLDERAGMLVPAPGAIMIPESAFNRALEEANLTGAWLPEAEKPSLTSRVSRFLSHGVRFLTSLRSAADSTPLHPQAFGVDVPTRLKATALAGTANELGTLGIIGDLLEDSTFSGNLFIVLREPLVDRETGRVESTDYAIAAVELSGRSQWLGTEARFAVDPSLSRSTGRCCGPMTICDIPIPPTPDPTPWSSSDLTPPCNIGFCPSERVGVTAIAPPEFERKLESEPNVVKLFILNGGIVRDALQDPTLVETTCINVLDKFCSAVKPVCDHDDIGFTTDPSGDADSGSGSNPCGVGGSSPGHNVPEICTVISGWENLPFECGGWCDSCAEPYYTRHRLPPGCEVAQPMPDSDMCTPSTPEMQYFENLRMQQKAGWMPGSNTAAVHCEPTGRDGIQVCTECDSGGNCGQRVEKPLVDPTISSSPTGEQPSTNVPLVEKGIYEEDDWDIDIIEVPPVLPKDTEYGDGVTSPDAPPNPPTVPQQPGSPSVSRSSPGKKVNPLVFGPGSKQKADPIRLGDGSLQIEHVDLSFDCPVGTLQFKRSYSSQSGSRSTLGSNWLHNWDVRIQPLNEDTLPAWASPYCAGSPETETCLLLHEGNGSVQMFSLDLQTRLFLPQAGSTDTIASAVGGGWALRRKDGSIRYFNSEGYLVNERDRFGNGFAIEYEPTPLYELYRHYCSPEELTTRNETKHSRRCSVLAYLNEETSIPASNSDAWHLTEADFPLRMHRRDPPLYDRLAYARAYFLHLLSLGPDVQSVYGFRKLRPVRVTDDIGRSLQFRYYRGRQMHNPLRRASTPAYDFASRPEAELLEGISGPAGTSVRFTYGLPQRYPSDLNQQFLVQVDRHDVKSATDVEAAPDRQYRFLYQWPEGAAQSYDAFAETVYEKYLAYYSTFVGCSYREVYACPGGGKGGNLKISEGDPAALARREKNAYISDVADNIIQVISDERSESETRFVADPNSPVFGHAIAQRYGSQHAASPPSPIPLDDPSHNWQTSLPRLVLAYQEAGPADGSDLTDSFLPTEIRDRYPLETIPEGTIPGSESGTLEGIVMTADDPTDSYPPCNYSQMAAKLKELPGYQERLPYYDVKDSEAHPNLAGQLYRSRLSPEQLALAQVSDPTHNDLLSVLEPNPATPNDRKDHIAKRLVGRRHTISQNANRICAWVQMVDRDGDTHFYGLNYHGQPLVEAVKERNSASFLFTERLFNADGLVVQLRRPTRGARLWSTDAGYTAYTYNEIDPKGNRGWNDWLPVFWSRRTNLLRMVEYAAGGEVVDDNELSGTFASSLGRFQQFTYEPIFNQLQSVREGSIEHRSANDGALSIDDITHSVTEYLFDYQELLLEPPTVGTSPMDPVLDDLSRWGFHWSKSSASAYDYQTIAAWQLPVKFFGTDLNGDGIMGFRYGNRPADRARGVPVVELRSGLNRSEPQVKRIAWAPHGKPAAVRDVDDSFTVFEYYSVGSAVTGSPYGLDQKPTDAQVSSAYRGFLGRIRQRRFSEDYPLVYGPSNEAPCTALSGPYQWLLPASCTSPQEELLALGLPEEAVQAILSSTTDNGRWISTAFAYSVLGKTRLTWEETGTTRTVRDTDGRELRSTDPRGITSRYSYTFHGYPESTRIADSSGKPLGETFRQFDEEGRLVYDCQALSDGGCKPYDSSLQPTDAMVNRYEYWPEGSIRSAVDPEGRKTEFSYNERQLLTHEKATASNHLGEWRATSHEYNLDGNVIAVHHGDQMGTASGLLSEISSYDGLGRLTSYTDTRGYNWQVAYSQRDLPTRYKRQDIPYALASTSTRPSWETVFRYDNFGRLARREDNGMLTAHYQRTLGGHVYQTSSSGIRESYTTYDLLGRPVWTRDAAGNQVVHTWRATPHESSATTIRTDEEGRRHTIATVTRLDPLGLPIEEVQYGSGVRRRTTWRRDGAGFVIEVRNPDDNLVIYDRNLLGWPRTISKQRTLGPHVRFDVSTFRYNKRGQVAEVSDPANQRTQILYDAFGAARSHSIAGQPQVSETYSYDNLGRLVASRVGGETIEYQYDNRGDLVSTYTEVLPGRLVPLSRRSFDDLGRVVQAENFNPVLSSLLPSLPDRTITQQFDYDAQGHVRREEIQVGTGPAHPVYSHWSILPRDVWQREMSYPAGARRLTEWRETFDRIGRLAQKARLVGGTPVQEITFEWLGDLYTGRSQEQSGRPSPFREQRKLDQFGLTTEWSYTAIDLDLNRQPRDPAEGSSYCGGPWRTDECGGPLMKIRAVRDLVGRIVSLKQRFGYPRFGGGGELLANRPPAPWRGYAYNPREQLDRVWEHNGFNSEISTTDIRSYLVTAADIRNLGSDSEQWVYDREPAVGGTTAIRNDSNGQQRWALSAPRGAGHQIRRVEIDGSTRVVTHDAAGRIKTDGALTYIYGPRAQLAAVIRGKTVDEAYAYAADGRLAAIFSGNEPRLPALSFAYDGEQIVAAFDHTDAMIWEAVWGPGLDQIIEWRDHRGGHAVDHIPLLDHRNSVVATWDVGQNRGSQTVEYDPEGRLTVREADGQTACREQGSGTVCANPVGIPFGFLSAWRSPASGLVYLRNRWYSPELGQFLSHDPLGFTDSYNLYAYAAFDPINKKDLLGLDSKDGASTEGKTTGAQSPRLTPPRLIDFLGVDAESDEIENPGQEPSPPDRAEVLLRTSRIQVQAIEKAHRELQKEILKDPSILEPKSIPKPEIGIPWEWTRWGRFASEVIDAYKYVNTLIRPMIEMSETVHQAETQARTEALAARAAAIALQQRHEQYRQQTQLLNSLGLYWAWQETPSDRKARMKQEAQEEFNRKLFLPMLKSWQAPRPGHKGFH